VETYLNRRLPEVEVERREQPAGSRR